MPEKLLNTTSPHPDKSGWIFETSTFKTTDQSLNLFSWSARSEPLSSPRTLIIIHGMGEHSGRYQHVPKFVCDSVDSVFAYDQRGHGRSEGLRGHIENFDLFASDAADVVRRIHGELTSKFGKSEIHVLGHSLGGLIALRMALLHTDLPVKSTIISAPFLGLKAHVPWIKKTVAGLLTHVWGSLQLPTAIDAAVISHDNAIVEQYKNDRLVHDKMTPKFFAELNEAQKKTLEAQGGILWPMLMLVPLADQLVDPEVTLSFYRALKHDRKTLVTYPDFFHEPLNELGKEKVFQEINTWIRSQN